MSLVGDMIVQSAALADTERLTGIGQRWEAYYGNLPRPLRVRPGQQDDNVRLNFASVIVNEGVSFLFGNDIDFQVAAAKAPSGGAGEDAAGAGDTEAATNPADDWLEECWVANTKMTFLQSLAINGGVTGDVYVKVLPPGTAQNPGAFPRLVALDPATMTAIWDPRDITQVLQWQSQWHGMDPQTNKPVAYRQLVTRAEDGLSWEILDQHSDDRGSAWVTDDRATWPFAWSPIFHCQNLPAPNQFYGVSDLEEDVVEVAKAVNFNASNTNRILRFHGHPKAWGKGFNAKQMETAVDGTIVFQSKDAELHNLEMESDLAGATAYYDRIMDALHAIARVPKVATGQLDNLGQLSGLALKVLYGPLLRKNALKQRLYGDMLQDLSRRLLEVGGFGAGQRVTIPWPDPLPSDPVAEGTSLEIDERLGASKATLLKKRGYDPTEEKKRKTGEQQDLGDSLLGQFDRGQSGNPGQAGG